VGNQYKEGREDESWPKWEITEKSNAPGACITQQKHLKKKGENRQKWQRQLGSRENEMNLVMQSRGNLRSPGMKKKRLEGGKCSHSKLEETEREGR